MSQTAVIETVEEVRQLALVRRFEPADLSKHGPWLLKRFAMVFPDLPEKYVAGYLSGLIFDNEHAFFYQDHAVALAQMVHSPGIKTVKVVQERFVWVEDIKNKDQLEKRLRWRRWCTAPASKRSRSSKSGSSGSKISRTRTSSRTPLVFMRTSSCGVFDKALSASSFARTATCRNR